MVIPTRPSRADLLLWSRWLAFTLLVANSVVWLNFLDGPVTRLGNEDDTTFTVHWVPAVLLAWVVGVSVQRSRTRHVRLSGPYPRASRPQR